LPLSGALKRILYSEKTMDDTSHGKQLPDMTGEALPNQLRRNDRSSIPEGMFKPKLTTSETKADKTTKTARSIISAEMAAREAKTERLRQARMARDAATSAAKPKPHA
jgi:hypothetical protein